MSVYRATRYNLLDRIAACRVGNVPSSSLFGISNNLPQREEKEETHILIVYNCERVSSG